jgi:TolB protein
VRNEDFGNIASSSIWVMPAGGGAPVRVTDEQWHNTSPAWLPGRSSLLYVSNRDGGRDLYQIDLGRSGQPSHEAVRLSTGLNAATVSVAAAGNRLAYAAFSRIANVWSLPIPRSGSVSLSRAQPVTTGSQEIEGFDLSVDERWLAFDSNRGGAQQLYRMPLPAGEVEQLTSGDVPCLAAAFSFDGRELLFHSFRDGIRQLFVMPAEGGTPVQVTAGNSHSRIGNWSPDGRSIAFVKNALSPDQETAVVSRDSRGRWGPSRTLLKGGAAAVWSPDGSRVVTEVRTEGGKFAVAVVPAGGGAPRILGLPQDRSESGLGWAFSPDGRFVYYINKSPNQRTGVWRVPATGGPSRLVASYDGAPGGANRMLLRVQGNRLYFSLGDPQSDVWTTEIISQR